MLGTELRIQWSRRTHPWSRSTQIALAP